jgi:hypothetical protein
MAYKPVDPPIGMCQSIYKDKQRKYGIDETNYTHF